jgi:hypothetical protein
MPKKYNPLMLNNFIWHGAPYPYGFEQIIIPHAINLSISILLIADSQTAQRGSQRVWQPVVVNNLSTLLGIGR